MDSFIRKPLSSSQISSVYSSCLQFQVLEWYSRDHNVEDILESDDNSKDKLLIHMFGVTDKGHSVCINVSGFKPCFYIQVPDSWTISNKHKFMTVLTDKFSSIYPKSSLVNDIDVNESKLIKRKIFFGFRNTFSKFIKLVFKNSKSFNMTKKIIRENEFKIDNTSFSFDLFHEKVDIVLQFIHEKNIGSVGWIEINPKTALKSDLTKCQIEYLVDINQLKPLDRTDIAPFRQMSYDIECYSHDPHKFPQASNTQDCVTQIGSSFQVYGSPEIEFQHIVTLGGKKPIPSLTTQNSFLQVASCEKNLLLTWKDLVNKMDPDIIYGYNNHGFDDSYLYDRAGLNKITRSFCGLSKFKFIDAELMDKSFSSSAYGTSKWRVLSIPGRINFDILVYIQREFKLDSYKMNSVAESFLKLDRLKSCLIPGSLDNNHSNHLQFDTSYYGKIYVGQELTLGDGHEKIELGSVISTDISSTCFSVFTEKNISETIDCSDYYISASLQKNPVTPEMIFKSKESGDPDQIRNVCDYCLKDTQIPLRLVSKMSIFINQIQMALVTHVPFKFLLEKGQQIKVFSQIIRETNSKKFLIPNIKSSPGEFEGATVLSPDLGAFFIPVLVLDFASLYPSIIRAHNFCYSSIVLDDQFDNLEGFDYLTVSWVDQTTNKQYSYKFVQNTETIIPDLLKTLIEQRKLVRSKMKLEKDPFKLMVLNGFQLALKVSANSIYGFLAAQTLQCRPISACVTAVGRQMIGKTKQFVDENYPDFETIYGDTDSVFVAYKRLKLPGTDNIIKELDLKNKQLVSQILESCFVIGEDMAEKASGLFKSPIQLEFEKVYLPFISFGKKMYSGLMYEPPNNTNSKRDSKGIVLKRRDNPNITKIVYQGILDILFREGSLGISNSIVFLREKIVEILEDKIPIEDLVVTKTYKNNYKSQNIPHKILAEKMMERDPGNAPSINERIPYVFIENKQDNLPQYQKVEHPEFVKEHRLKLDSLYYLKQIKNPISQLLSTFMNQQDIDKIFNSYKSDYSNKKKGIALITPFLIRRPRGG